MSVFLNKVKVFQLTHWLGSCSFWRHFWGVVATSRENDKLKSMIGLWLQNCRLIVHVTGICSVGGVRF